MTLSDFKAFLLKSQKLDIQVPIYIPIARNQAGGDFGSQHSLKGGDLGLGLPEKKKGFKNRLKNNLKSTGSNTGSTSHFTGSVSRFVPIIVLLAILCIQTYSASAATNEVATGEENASIIDFFSDNNLSDATVRFDQSLENVSLVFTLNSENRVLKSETIFPGHVEKGQEITKVVFWGLKEDFGQGTGKDRESYTAQLVVKNDSEILDSRKLSFSYRSPILSNYKLIDFSADSEKASTMITLKSSTDLSTGLRSVQVPEPGVIDLNLKLLSGNEVVYSERQENIPLTEAYYKPIYWPFLLEKGRKYTALLKVHSHAPDITAVYRSDFKAKEKVEIVDKDVRVDEYGASVTIVGRSQVPFDGTVKVVLTPRAGEVKVFDETADMLTSGKEDTLGIIWQGIPKGDYNVKVYVVDLEGEVLDSYETALRVIEPVAEVTPAEKSPAFDFLAALGIFLSLCVFPGRKER